MVHLVIHLATEAKLAGPVHYRWMYRFEREMRTFKTFVRNKAYPESSIAEGYAEKECLTFCSRYLSMIETHFNRLDRNEEVEPIQLHSLSVFSKMGKSLGKANLNQLSIDDWKQAHRYVLRNCDEVQPLLEEFEQESAHNVDFEKWIENRITKLWNEGDESVTEELLCLARGPMKSVITYEGYIINGFRFHTKRRQRNRKTQNSGVIVKGDNESGEKDFFGVLEDVIMLEYDALKNHTSPHVVLFRCKWFDVLMKGVGLRRISLDLYLLISLVG